MDTNKSDCDIELSWLNAAILGTGTVVALVEKGLLLPVPDGRTYHDHDITPKGILALRDHETVDVLSDLHSMMDKGYKFEDHAPSRSEYMDLVKIVRYLMLEVVALRGEVASLKQEKV